LFRSLAQVAKKMRPEVLLHWSLADHKGIIQVAGCGRYPGENIHPGRPSPYSQTPNWVRVLDVADDRGDSFVRICHRPVTRPNGGSEDKFPVGIRLWHVRDNLGNPRIPTRL